jgi:hypothetical protein
VGSRNWWYAQLKDSTVGGSKGVAAGSEGSPSFKADGMLHHEQILKQNIVKAVEALSVDRSLFYKAACLALEGGLQEERTKRLSVMWLNGDCADPSGRLDAVTECISAWYEAKISSVYLTGLDLHVVPTLLLTHSHGKSLISLDLRSNKLSSLPPSIAALSALRYLDVSRNRLGRLPDVNGLIELVSCTWGGLAIYSRLHAAYSQVSIDAAYNFFSELPSGLLDLPKLQKKGVNFFANPLKEENWLSEEEIEEGSDSGTFYA